MLAAFLTTLLFSVSGVTAMRSTRYLPSLEANLWRLLLATAMLALYAHTWGAGVGGPALGWFVLSGFIGFGIGDVALYLAYPRLGSRLVILVVHCVAAPLAAAVEWLWLGVPMTGREMLASCLILGGVAVALFPGNLRRTAPRAVPGRAPVSLAGVGFALIAAGGQGFGAVLSRRAFGVARDAGEAIDGISAAYQRILAGVVVSAVSYAIARYAGLGAASREAVRRPTRAGASVAPAPEGGLRRAAPWIVVNAFAGPALGVSCFQWALAERGTGVVLPIVALTPLMIIPFSMAMEGERPTARSLLGGVIAVVGAVIHASGQ